MSNDKFKALDEMFRGLARDLDIECRVGISYTKTTMVVMFFARNSEKPVQYHIYAEGLNVYQKFKEIEDGVKTKFYRDRLNSIWASYDAGLRAGIKSIDTDAAYYIKNDIDMTKATVKILDKKFNLGWRSVVPKIKNVIFNDPATIVIWSNGDKTVVKCEERDTYDPEKGLAMAISKYILGNKYDYYHTFKKWLKKAPKAQKTIVDIRVSTEEAAEAFKNLAKAARKEARKNG